MINILLLLLEQHLAIFLVPLHREDSWLEALERMMISPDACCILRSTFITLDTDSTGLSPACFVGLLKSSILQAVIAILFEPVDHPSGGVQS